MTVAYFDCFGGASGDMILGALLDAGLPLADLTSELDKLPLKGYRLELRREVRGGLVGLRAVVTVQSPPGEPQQRRLGEVLHLIDLAPLAPKVKDRAVAVFRRLAAAEAKVHGMTPEEVPLHEVGATDAIVDVVGAVVGLERLGVAQVFVSALPSGAGWVPASHGALPLPAPATLELAAMAGAPLRPTPGLEAELTTPTAAALLTTLGTFQQPLLRLQRLGYGVGARDLGAYPNLLRLWLGEPMAAQLSDALILLETNIDDMNPELYEHLMDRLFAVGARDVWFTPIQMKKNRPATMVSVLAPLAQEGAIIENLFRESSTLGVRVQPLRRHEALRESMEFASSLGLAAVKVKRFEGKVVGVAPEYERCRHLALERGLALQEVYHMVAEEARRHLEAEARGRVRLAETPDPGGEA